MRTKITTAVAAVSALALALTGCAGGGGTDGADGGEVTLQMVESLTNPTRTELLKTMLADFEEANPGIKVQLVSPPTEQADQKIQQMLQSGSGVDVLEVRDLTVGPFSNNGWLYDMAGDLESWDGYENLTDQAKSFTIDSEGKGYFVPYGFYGLSLFYRTDLVKEAGFDGAPKTWDELVEQATAIQDPAQNRYGYAFRGGANSIGQVMSILEAYNADNLDAENAYKVTSGDSIFSTPESQTAIDKYIELFTTGSPESSVAWGYAEMVQAFTNGSTAFLLQDPEVIGVVNDSSLTEDQWSVAPNLVGPTGKAAWPMATAGWGVAEASEHKEEAVKLVEWLSGDASTTFAKENSLVPILAEAADDEFFKTGPWAAYVEMTSAPDTYLSVVEPRGSSWWTEWSQRSESDLQQVLLGKMSTADLLSGWDQYWTEKWEA
ncbi:ABC transporter substrate-binding protein [Tessaracoccus palaemonis]|uniref:Sugar ABC transporter substrate-binding protein n=1 Tax=Tessaracoccus palaemonis TaxID=2829499 RepID=A0ABX8SKU9_9ACTN|nr:sugar ABC transporter substrate-binding protein [Tessaracoccus palaemonis]QXT62778.1 sugar ABC transporter substrate-binding protein [Tessaracoccus palaemonis]